MDWVDLTSDFNNKGIPSLKCIYTYTYTEMDHLHSFLGFCRNYQEKGTFLVAQAVKNLPAIQETQIQPLGQEDALE